MLLYVAIHIQIKLNMSSHYFQLESTIPWMLLLLICKRPSNSENPVTPHHPLIHVLTAHFQWPSPEASGPLTHPPTGNGVQLCLLSHCVQSQRLISKVTRGHTFSSRALQDVVSYVCNPVRFFGHILHSILGFPQFPKQLLKKCLREGLPLCCKVLCFWHMSTPLQYQTQPFPRPQTFPGLHTFNSPLFLRRTSDSSVPLIFLPFPEYYKMRSCSFHFPE